MKGAAWMVAMRWGLRLLGLVNIAIIARLLAPSDFGLVAMAMAVVALADAVMNLAGDRAIIQLGGDGRRYYDSGWTLRLMQASVIAAVILALAWPAAGFYGDARVGPILMVAALGIFLRGFENIGTVAFRQNLTFGREFIYYMVPQTIAVLATISLALWLRSYWALVLGALVRQTSTMAFSYVISAYRPRLSLARMRDIWGFSQWTLVRDLGVFLTNESDRVIIGRLGGPGPVGLLTIGKELTSMISTEIAAPISRALYPGMVKLRDAPGRFRTAFRNAMAAIALVGLPLCAGLGLTASEVVPLLLGEKWLAAIPFVTLLSLAAIIRVLAGLPGDQAVVLGGVRAVAIASWLQAFLAIPLLVFGYQQYQLAGVAIALLAIYLLGLVINCGLVCRYGGARWGDYAGAWWRPVLATAAMALAVLAVEQTVQQTLHGGLWLLLLAKAGIGGLVYVAAALALWHLVGRPDGLERALLCKLGLGR